MKQTGPIAIAMSGGVDSSVAAALLKQAGYDVFGIMLRLWSPSPELRNRCCSPEDLALAQKIASLLEIPFYPLDVRDYFKATVVDAFIDGYAHGITPNPCLSCNRQVRWGFLLDRAIAIGATHMATGHYARVQLDVATYRLLRGKDRTKDQSYILSVLNQQQLAHAMFPLGEFTKDHVRRLATEFDLPVTDRGESQDLCFLGGMDYYQFLEMQDTRLPPPGPIETSSGELLGQHRGLAAYTIGQRKGIGISSSEPYYVLKKDMSTNRLIVGRSVERSRDEFSIRDLNWISGDPPDRPIVAQVRIRYKAPEVHGTLFPEDKGVNRVKLDKGLADITPGQAAVFYEDEYCLGGGIIQA